MLLAYWYIVNWYQL